MWGKAQPTGEHGCRAEFSLTLSIPQFQLLLRERFKEGVRQHKSWSLHNTEPLLSDWMNGFQSRYRSLVPTRSNDDHLPLLRSLHELGKVRLCLEDRRGNHWSTPYT